MNRLRLEFAAEQFLKVLNMERLNRGSQVSGRTLSDYTPEDRSSLMRAVGAAIRAESSAFDKGFAAWCEKRSVNTD